MPWMEAVEVTAMSLLFFAALYFITGSLLWWLTRHLLPSLGIGHALDPRPLAAGQIRREIRASSLSILIFGVGTLVPWGMLQLGWAQLAPNPSLWRVVLETAALFLWNEPYFYINHRLLHTRWLRRFHQSHHRSHVPTPFSTYAFHPLEAAMVGSMPLFAMLVHDFSLATLVTMSVGSIVVNGLGHCNYAIGHRTSADGWFAFSRRHQQHHALYRGNYGFVLDIVDRCAGTLIAADAVEARQSSHAPDSVRHDRTS